MRAAVYYHNHDVRIEDRPIPLIGPGEVLVQVHTSGICGSDVMEWYRRPRAPLILGHEVAGKIVELGDNVQGFQVGDRVTAAHHVPCNTCHYCLSGHHTLCPTLKSTNFDPGGFVEYVRLMPIHVDRGLFKLSDTISYEEATFAEPLGCVLRGQRVARLQPWQSVLVVGSGLAGLLHIKLARATTTGTILAVDINKYRLDAALDFGADVSLDARDNLPAKVREANGGFLAQLVIVCTGAPAAIAQALTLVEPGGTVLFFAPASSPDFILPLSLNDVFWQTDVTLTTTYGASPSDYADALELISSGQVGVTDMISHQLGLSEVGLGFRMVADAQESLKVLLDHSR